MTETKKNNFNLIAAIAFVILALIQCYSFSVTARIYGTFNAYILISLLRMAAYILPAAALFTDRRDKTGTGLILSGLGVLAFLSLYDFFHGFVVHSYSVYDFYYSYYSGSYYAYHFNLFCMLPALIELLGSLCMFAVSLCLLTGYIPKAKSRAKDFWYLPAVLTAASLILGIFLSVVFRIVSDGWTYDVLHTEAAFFSCLLIIAAFLFTAGRIAYPDGFEKKAYARMSSGGCIRHPRHRRRTRGIRSHTSAGERLCRHGKMRIAADLYLRHLLAHLDLPDDRISEPHRE